MTINNRSAPHNHVIDQLSPFTDVQRKLSDGPSPTVIVYTVYIGWRKKMGHSFLRPRTATTAHIIYILMS